MKYAIIGASVLILLSFLVGWYLISQPKNQDVSIEISAPDQVLLGQPFNLSVSYANKSDLILDDVRLVLTLPQGVSFIGSAAAQRVSDQIIGSLGPGSINRAEFQLVASEGPQSVKRMSAKLVYKTNSKARYEAKTEKEIVIGEPVVRLGFTVPENVFSGENFEIQVSFENTSNEDLKGLELKLEYPQVFQFQRASLEPDRSNNLWNLGGLLRHASGTITISGTLVGSEGMFFNFGGTLSAEFLGQKYTLNAQTATVSLSASPLAISILGNESNSPVVQPGGTILYRIRYRNNSNTTLANVNIKANLSGEMFDYFSLQTPGVFSSIANTITWFPANTPNLLAVGPGEGGEVTFLVRLKNSFPIRKFGDKNYTVVVRGQIESPTIPTGTLSSKTLSVASLEAKVAGKVDIESKGFFRDPSAQIFNSGPFPPRVNQATQYTVHWVIKNYSTDITGLRVSAFLQGNTRFIGNTKSTIDTKPTYDAASGLVTWVIPALAATKGYIGEPVEAVFQVENTPSLIDIGKQVIFFGETKLTAHDSFVNWELSSAAGALNTALPYDLSVAGTSNVVQP